MKLCKDCKWCKRDRLYLLLLDFKASWKYAKCIRPDPKPFTSLVNGQSEGPNFCMAERGPYGCGPDAKYFEAKE